MKVSPSMQRFCVRLVLAILLGLAAFDYSIVQPVVDGFHEGEYLGTLWAIRSYLAGAAPFPLLVHGPMDFIPALLAGSIAGDHSVIVFTRFINTFLAAVAWILFLDMILISLRRNEHRYAAGILCCLLFLGMIVVIPPDTVEHQQAFLAIRDIFLIVALWCALRSISTASTISQYLFMLMAGTATAASLYWAYDRFLAGVVFAAAFAIVLLIQRAWRLLLALIVGGIAGLLLIPLFAPSGSLIENIDNLVYWMKFSGEVWHLSYAARAPTLPTALAMVVLLVIFTKQWHDNSSRNRGERSLGFSAGLLALQAFFLLKYLNLPRQPNNYYFVWPFILLASTLTFRWPVLRSFDDAAKNCWDALRNERPRQQLGVVLVGLCLLAVVTNNMLTTSLLNVCALSRPPADTDLLPKAARDVANIPSLRAGGCVLLWSNEGVFATALHRPFCTHYMYPIYASRAHEADLLREISAAEPAIVIFNTPFWSMDIYGRNMRERLPAVNRYLQNNYQMFARDDYIVGVHKSL